MRRRDFIATILATVAGTASLLAGQESSDLTIPVFPGSTSPLPDRLGIATKWAG